ncbi:disease resistance protein RUN1-like [Argentina anserina]|uniref:disease resistance protein RUN1-like n=1 Tax=Argentina anserina TaxID=57926 RepID=UPI00217685D2|nr:disease resistance protein RUN1-like [Potentilla anserina]
MDSSTPQFGTSSSSSSSSSSTHSFTHDVFLSFRGPDTRNNITCQLHRALVDKGIYTFIDNDLTRGKDISNELLQVIEGSRIAIVVFSANYAYSKWCLEELVKIFQCKESKQQIVYPIFYKVQPSEIRYQKGHFGEGIAHLSKYKDNLEKVESWKAVLREAATLSGWLIMEGGHEATVLDEIVKEISSKLMKYTSLDVATYPVGIESRVENVVKLLNVAEDDPQMIGIWGVGGIGKTTLAKAVYNSISNMFEHSCFLSIVKEESSSHGDGALVKLQNILLSKIIERNPPKLTNIDEGINLLKKNLSKKRVLLVLDDVTNIKQLRKLAGGCDWFGPRSRVIITTRDKNCLEAHSVKKIYDAKELDDVEALKLFSFNAFRGNIYIDEFSDLAQSVVRYAKGIPLVLEVLGSDLCSKSKDEWEDALKYYKKYPKQKVQEILQRSYEGLEHGVKEVFLHIACFFKNYRHREVITILRCCDLNPTFALKVLKEKALIKFQIDPFWKENIIWMHDLIEDMGKEIVRRESPNEPGRRSRLWNYEDVYKVLEDNKGTDKIKGIVLDPEAQQKIRLNSGSFKNMKNLQILEVLNLDKLDAEVQLDYLPDELRAINWTDTSLQSLPANFNPRKLGMLHMKGPCTIPLVNQGFKNMPHLKSIQLWSGRGLATIPDLSGLTSLERLSIRYCNDLVEVHPSVGRLDKLTHLEITFCKNLWMFPNKIKLKSLETLDLSNYPLAFFPKIEGEMKSLSRLSLSCTRIKKLPCSVGNLTGLKSLSLYSCHDLTNVPSSIFYKLQRLEDLDLRKCDNLVTFPTMSVTLAPPVFSARLRRVRLNGCQRLEEISEFAREIESLDVTGCRSLEGISHLSNNLESTDQKMMARIELTDCQKLCDNLAGRLVSKVAVDNKLLLSHVLKKRNTMPSSEDLMGEAEKLTALLSLFISCANSEEFLVKFPASAPIPNWLSHRHDVEYAANEEHEFFIKIPQNVNWDSTGLALCMSRRFVGMYKSDDRFPEYYQDSEEKLYRHRREIYINGVRFHDEGLEPGHLWLHYIPIKTIKRRLGESGMPPPDTLRVRFCYYIFFEGSCGVQLIEDRAAVLQVIGNAFSSLPDWQEEAYQKIKVMKETYMPELYEMYQKVVSSVQEQELLPPDQDKLEKLKVFETMLECLITVLLHPKVNISPDLKEDLVLHENRMINFIRANKLGVPVSSLPVSSLHLPPSEMHDY